MKSMVGIDDGDFAAVDPPPPPPRNDINGSIYHASTNRFLFEDIKARRVGDTITVILEEATNASKSASTNASKQTGYDTPVPTIFGKGVTKDGRDVLVMDVDNGFDFAGSGDSAQSNSLTGSITVTVVSVMTNGNLKVRGEKLLTLNQGSEIVRVSGIVRPTDISPQNSIRSTQIASAQITYSGDGFVNDSNKPGIFTKFFQRFWPL